MPLLGLALLRGVPRLDVEWQHQPSHFWLVLAAGAINAVLAYVTAVAARRRAEPRVFLVSMAFLVSAGFLGLHALATPGVLLSDSTAGFQAATPVGLVCGSAFVGWSSLELEGSKSEWVNAHSRAILGVTLGVLGLWAAWSLAGIPPLTTGNQIEEGSVLLAVIAVPAVASYLVAAARYLVEGVRTRSSMLLVMAAAFVLLAEALVAVVASATWHASWWEWHLLMLAAFSLIAYSAHRQWHEERFKDLYLTGGTGTREVSVMFADLQGFTSFSESHSPVEVTDMLKQYFVEVIPPIAESFGGQIDRLIGDAIMVTFNRRGDQPDHAERAARAALELQRRSASLSDRHPDWPRFRVGINSGLAALGVVGAEGGRTHTVIGDAVNVASRLEGHAPVGKVVVSGATAERIPGAQLEPIGAVSVKGRADAVDAYILVATP
jgi:class 3 adenylate cyclase